MVPFSILTQPNSTVADPSFPVASYRDIYFEVLADSVVTPNQPMYCDVYIVGEYYKTFTAYSIVNVGGTNGLYEFDLQDAFQEIIKTLEYAGAFTGIESTFYFTSGDASSCTQRCPVIVYFRGSSYTADGILVPEGPQPIQATATTPAVSGLRTFPSNQFSVVMATLPPYFVVGNVIDITSNPFLTVVASNQVIFPSGAMISDTEIYPLSNMPLNNIPASFVALGTPDLSPTVYQRDMGAFPLLIRKFGTFSSLSRDYRNCYVAVLYGSLNLSWNIYPLPSTATTLGPGLGPGGLGFTYYMPCGMEDLRLIDPLLIPFLVTANVDMYYRVALIDADANKYAFISPMFKVGNGAIEVTRLLFQNSYGHFEGVSFVRMSEQHTTTSSDQFTPYVNSSAYDYPGQQQLGHKRYNIRANDLQTLTATFSEQLMPWLKDLMQSPLIVQQIKDGTNATRTVRLIDGTWDTKKTVTAAGVKYTVSFQIRPATDYITLRN